MTLQSKKWLKLYTTNINDVLSRIRIMNIPNIERFCTGPILTMHTWGGAMFVTGSTDRTTRFWDLRSRDCVNMVAAPPTVGSVHGEYWNLI